MPVTLGDFLGSTVAWHVKRHLDASDVGNLRLTSKSVCRAIEEGTELACWAAESLVGSAQQVLGPIGRMPGLKTLEMRLPTWTHRDRLADLVSELLSSTKLSYLRNFVYRTGLTSLPQQFDFTRQLASSPWVRELRSLELVGAPGSLQPLLETHCPNLQTVRLSGRSLDEGCIEALSKEAWPALQHLELHALSVAGASRVQAELSSQLTCLELVHCNLSSNHIHALFPMHTAPGAESSSDVDAGARLWPRLRQLSLQHSTVCWDTIPLLTARQFSCLKTLDLSYMTGVQPYGAWEALAACPWLHQLQALTLRHTQQGPRGLGCLLSAPMPNMQTLTLGPTMADLGELLAFKNKPHGSLAKLQELHLCCGCVSSRELRRLGRWPSMPSLEKLRLYGVRLGSRLRNKIDFQEDKPVTPVWLQEWVRAGAPRLQEATVQRHIKY